MRTAEGHAVRALYLYIAMADMARIDGDGELAAACEAIFEDILAKKMYITGGTGSSFHGETFTFAYDLPNQFAYSETCAGIALCLFCDRLAKRKNRAKYHDIFERALYNVVLAGESQDGKGFFYVNPLEMHESLYDYNEGLRQKLFCPIPERVEVFDCSCCPPNLTRFLESIGSYIYGVEEGRILINQYISSHTHIGETSVRIRSQMPYCGKIGVSVAGTADLRLRVPSWQNGMQVRVNGKKVCSVSIEDEYLCIQCTGNTEIELDFCMQPRFVYANENVWYDNGRRAVEYGPLVLCGESVDNGKNLRAVRIPSLEGAQVQTEGEFSLTLPAVRLHTGPALYSTQAPTEEAISLRLIPYFAWANRGKGDMQIWWLP